MRILLDMDEVLVDFVGGACKCWDTSKEKVLENWEPGKWDMVPPLAKTAGNHITEKHFWDVIKSRGETFWLDLEEQPWCDELVVKVKSYTDDWHIISAPSLCETSYAGKVKWLKSKFGKDFSRFAITPHKECFANPDAYLIDDRESNIEIFRKHKGNGILFPAYHNRLHEMRKNPMDRMDEVFDMLTRFGKFKLRS